MEPGALQRNSDSEGTNKHLLEGKLHVYKISGPEYWGFFRFGLQSIVEATQKISCWLNFSSKLR